MADTAGPYRLLDHVGEGGMGVVLRAVGHDGREVAVKLLKPELAAHADFRQRLAREVETMRRVRSPYVAEVLDADLSGERPYVVTRFIRGRALDDEVRASGPLTGEPLRRVAAGLAEALAAIHRAGVVHRDLKPTNVMLVDGVPVVIDFGIAHVMDATRLTRVGRAAGTPGYMGPEIIEGRPPGPAADVYGWAATVTFAACGRSPYGSGPLDAVLTRIADGRPHLDGVPPRLAPLVLAALDRDPDRRPSAAELVERLREPDEPPATVVDRPRSRPPLAVYKAYAYLSVATAAAACAVLPVVASAGVVAAGWYLRAGDSAVRRRRVPVRTAGDLLLAPARSRRDRIRATALLVPATAYAALVAAGVGAALAARGRFGGDAGPVEITKGTAAVFAYTLLAGPRMMAPRRQLVRVLSGLARRRRSTALAGLLLAGLAAGAALAAWTAPPSWWPLPAPYRVIGRLAALLGDPR